MIILPQKIEGAKIREIFGIYIEKFYCKIGAYALDFF